MLKMRFCKAKAVGLVRQPTGLLNKSNFNAVVIEYCTYSSAWLVFFPFLQIFHMIEVFMEN
jgi:hypothetical protein